MYINIKKEKKKEKVKQTNKKNIKQKKKKNFLFH